MGFYVYMGSIFKIALGVAASSSFGRDAIFFILLTSLQFQKSCGKKSIGRTKFIKTLELDFLNLHLRPLLKLAGPWIVGMRRVHAPVIFSSLILLPDHFA